MTQKRSPHRAPPLPRLVLAFLAAPVAAASPFIALALTSMSPPADAWRQVGLLLTIFGGAALAVGIPAYVWLRPRADLNIWTAVLTGIGIAAFVALSISLILGAVAMASSPVSGIGLILYGGLMALLGSPLGALGGAAFWAIAGSAPKASHL